jgi:exonuclease III
VEALGG